MNNSLARGARGGAPPKGGGGVSAGATAETACVETPHRRASRHLPTRAA